MLRAVLDTLYRIVFNRQKFEAYVARQIDKAARKLVAFIINRGNKLNNPRIVEAGLKIEALLKKEGLILPRA